MAPKSSLRIQDVKAKPTRRNPRRGDLQVHPTDLGSLFAKRPLLLWEDEADYDELLSKVTAAVAPGDIIEAMWVKDITDFTWEVQRLRRLKAELLIQASQGVLEDLLRSIPGAGLIKGVQYTIPSLLASYRAGLKEAAVEVERILTNNGIDADNLAAQALSIKLSEVERIERLLAGIEARRNRILGEIYRRREMLVRQLRREDANVEDID
jgi:hypothetical protein